MLLVKLIQNLKREYQDSTSLDERIFYIIIPVAFAVSIVVTVLSIIEKVKLFTVICCCMCTVLLLFIFVFFRRNKLYFAGLVIVAIILTSIIVPVNFFTYGGFDSAMPTLMISLMLACAITIRNKYGWLVFTLALVANLLTFYLAIKHPDWVTPIPEKYIYIDYLVSFGVFSIAFCIICRNILAQTIKYSQVLKTHMDGVVYKTLINNEENVLIGKRHVAVMFLDISGFTSNTEQMDIQKVQDYCNTFFGICNKYINRYGAIFDKYIGDCVMVFWIEKEGEHESVYQACQMALDVCTELSQRQEEFLNSFGIELKCSCGLSFGEVIVGDIGAKDLKGFTIMGDPVNVASRLESLAQANEILLSENANKEIVGRMETVPFNDKTKIRGKNELIQIYQLKNKHPR